MRRLALVLVAAGCLAASSPWSAVRAQALPQCRVGLHVDRAGALNYPATIDAYDAAKGAWHVKYDNSTSSEWLPSERMTRSCVAAAAPTVTDAFFVGRWEIFVNPGIGYQTIGGERFLTVGTGAPAPPLTINADGTYVWLIDSRTAIRGRWRKMEAAEMKYGFKDKPGIRLVAAYEGKDWQVTRLGVRPSDNRDQLNIERIDLGVTFLATRMK